MRTTRDKGPFYTRHLKKGQDPVTPIAAGAQKNAAMAILSPQFIPPFGGSGLQQRNHRRYDTICSPPRTRQLYADPGTGTRGLGIGAVWTFWAGRSLLRFC